MISSFNPTFSPPPPGGFGDPSGTDPTALGKDDFMLMLVTQLSNQDPLNPMDGQEFAAQLAQFSSVEQLMHIGSMLEASAGVNAQLMHGINSSMAAGMVGKTVEARGHTVGLHGGEGGPLHFKLDGAATDVKVVIRNEAGQVVRTLTPGALAEGRHEIMWDGADDSGATLPDGSYSFSVEATDPQGEPVQAGAYLRGRIEQVVFEDGRVSFRLGNSTIGLEDILSILAD